MDYITRNVISLEEATVAKIANTIWTCSDMTIKHLNTFRSTQHWNILVKSMKEHNLNLPEVLKQQIDHLLPFIGFEIFKFVDYLSTKISIDDKYLKYCFSKFCWKTKGIIDRKKTVKMLIEESELNLATRYKLACAFCLEEDILKLWYELPVNQRSIFTSISNPSLEYLDIVCIWSLYNTKQETLISIKIEEQMFGSVYLYVFLCSVHECIPEAVAHYWQKIPLGEKLDAIFAAIRIIENKYDATSNELGSKFRKRLFDETVVFLFTQTSDEDLGLLNEKVYFFVFNVLKCFIEWPFLECFINAFTKLQQFFRTGHYLYTIKLIENKIALYRDCDNDRYRLLLKEVWTISFETNQELIDFYLPTLISNLLVNEETKLVSLILNDLSRPVRECLLFSDEGISICISLASKDRWDVLKDIVKMCVRQENLEVFKSLFGNQLLSEDNLSVSSEQMDFETISRLNNCLDNIFKKSDCESPPLKKFCSDMKL